MLLRRLMAHFRDQNWFAVVLDLLVVVVGLFIGLQVDTWWEGQRESRLEAVYISELREDFEANRSDLQRQAGRAKRIVEAMVMLHGQSLLPESTMPASALNEAFSLINDMPSFVLTRRVFDNLTGSGDLKLLRNRELKNALAEYYASAAVTAIVQATHEMELVQTFQPYIIENLDYAAVKRDVVDDFPLASPGDEARIVEVLNTRQFRNTVIQKWVIMTDLLDQFRSMLERTERVLVLLE